MTIVRLQLVDSSQIHSIGYNPETQTLAICFTRGYGENRKAGSVYHYSNVSQADFDAFNAAESKGKHFGQHIKPYPEKYPYVKVADAPQADDSEAPAAAA